MRHRDDALGELQHRDLGRVAEIDGAGQLVGRGHEPDQSLDQVVDVAEGAGLLAVPVHRNRLMAQRLHDEVRDHAPVVRMHARAVGVEDASDLDPELVLAVVVEEQRLRAALALVVARSRADRVYAAPVVLALGVHLRVAVHLAGRGLENLRLDALGEAEHVDRAVHAGLGRLNRIELVVDRRGRARQVVDLIDLYVQRKRDVVAQQLEAGMLRQLGDVALGPGVEIVHAQDVAALGRQPLAQVRAEKTGAPCDHHPRYPVTPHRNPPLRCPTD